MGPEIEPPEGEHKLLAQRIEGIIVGELSLLPYSEDVERLAQTYASLIELSNQLQKLGLSKTDVSIALRSIIARAVSPDSGRSTYTWLCNDSGLGELLDFDFKKIFFR